MNIGIVTEGDSEVIALPELYKQLKGRTGHVFLKPLRATVDPLAPVAVVAKGLAERVRLSFAKGASRVIVVLDREQAEVAPGARASEIEIALRKAQVGSIFVVMKDRTFENWLIASPEAFASQPARFPQHAVVAAIKEGRADGVTHATTLIDKACGKSDYDKVSDSKKILSKSLVDSMARNSRSFRRFLAVAGDSTYSASSGKYVPVS